MRPHILYALLKKEWRRHLANRGGIALALLLIAAAVLLSVFNPGAASSDGGGTGMVGGVHTCLVEYQYETPYIRHLKASKPEQLKIQFVPRGESPRTAVSYGPGTGAIHIRNSADANLRIQIWHPDGEPQAMIAYEQWLWRETRKYYQTLAAETLTKRGLDATRLSVPQFGTDDLWAVRESFGDLNRQLVQLLPGDSPLPSLVIDRKGLGGKVLDLRSLIATGMVVFSLYFTCVYLLPTLNCEERERGILLAQALSPASPWEIVAAKFLFYPTLGVLLAATLAGIYKFSILGNVFFWLALLAVGASFLGIGMTIATLARTQRAAFLGAMCYLLTVSLLLFIAGTNSIPFISYAFIEYHGPRILHAALSEEFESKHWLHLAAAGILAAIWMCLAAWLFRRRGWQ